MLPGVRTILLSTMAIALVVFAIVQDRVTASGARQYVATQRAAKAREAPAVTIDAVMIPAVERSVEQALLWSGIVLIVGFGVAAAVSHRTRRETARE